MLGKNKDKNEYKNEYNYTRYNDNSDSPIIYVGYFLLGIFLLAIFI